MPEPIVSATPAAPAPRPALMPLETALATLLSQAAPEPATESVSTFEAEAACWRSMSSPA